MAENKFVLKEISTYQGKIETLYEKPYETREEAAEDLSILEPILRKTMAKNPILPYVKFVIEEIPEA